MPEFRPLPSQELILSDDLPKQDPWRDDRLGYAPFAEQLARSIVGINAPNGYVIGLCGEWGSGKTTIINFTKAYIKNSIETGPNKSTSFLIIDFKPWLISGHQDLIGAFFKILSEQIASRKPRRVSDRFTSFLSRTQYVNDPIVDAMGKLAVAFDPTAGIASTAVTTITKSTLSRMVDTLLSNPSLQSTHESLRSLLANEPTRYLVIIDDIDRLEADEIRAIIKMLKSIGQLPNVIYLIAYDRAIISSAFCDHPQQREANYLEKIIQQELDIPNPSQHSLLNILDSELSFLESAGDSTLRWQYIVRFGIRRWVRHPRDVQRLANAVKFAWPALKDEFDPGDLLAMEAIRLFQRRAFNWIRDSRDLLFSDGAFSIVSEDQRQSAFNSIREMISEFDRPDTLTVLSALFPQHSKLLSGRHFVGQESVADLIKRRGIGCEAGYDTYFRLYPSSEAVPKRVISEILNNLEDKAIVFSILRAYITKQSRTQESMIVLLINELRAYFEGAVDYIPTQALLDALFEIGDQAVLLERRKGLISHPPIVHLSDFVNVILRCWGIKHAGERLVSAFASSRSVMFCAYIFVERARELGVIAPRSANLPLIDTDSFHSIGEILRRLIYTLRDNGELERVSLFARIAHCWKQLGDAAEAKQWIAQRIIVNYRFLVTICDGLVWHTYSPKGKSYLMKELPDAYIYDYKALLEASKIALSSGELNDEERDLVGTVARKIEEHLSASSNGGE